MKGFFIEITNNLLDPKHYINMGESIWLYMWLVDKITSITEEGEGIVLGGKPIKYEEVSKELGIHQNTYTKWIKKLKKYPYISVLRTPYGLVYKVLKAKKRFAKSDKEIHTKRGRDSHNRVNVIKTIQDNTKTYKKFFQGNPVIKDYGKLYVLENGRKVLFTGKESQLSNS